MESEILFENQSLIEGEGVGQPLLQKNEPKVPPPVFFIHNDRAHQRSAQSFQIRDTVRFDVSQSTKLQDVSLQDKLLFHDQVQPKDWWNETSYPICQGGSVTGQRETSELKKSQLDNSSMEFFSC